MSQINYNGLIDNNQQVYKSIMNCSQHQSFENFNSGTANDQGMIENITYTNLAPEFINYSNFRPQCNEESKSYNVEQCQYSGNHMNDYSDYESNYFDNSYMFLNASNQVHHHMNYFGNSDFSS